MKSPGYDRTLRLQKVAKWRQLVVLIPGVNVSAQNKHSSVNVVSCACVAFGLSEGGNCTVECVGALRKR